MEMRYVLPKITLVMVAFLASVSQLSAQQWERLPLNGGELQYFFQNSYNANEIIGYNYSNWSYYHSNDGGYSWKRIWTEKMPFHHLFRSVVFDRKNKIYVMAKNGIWRTTDFGVTWDSLKVPGGDHYHGRSQLKILPNDHIFVWDSDTWSLYKSTDEGGSWQEVGPNDREVIRDIYIDDSDDNIIMLLRYKYFVVTLDGGITWVPYPIPDYIRPMLLYDKSEGKLNLFIIKGTDSGELLHSCDSGRTWNQLTNEPIIARGGDCSGSISAGPFLLKRDSLMLIPYCHTIQISHDSGKTFNQVTDLRIQDAVIVGEHLVVSEPFQSVLRSTDYGSTWNQMSVPDGLFNYQDAEFVHGEGDTLFALLSDKKGTYVRNSVMMESADGGITWNTLYKTSLVYQLFTGVGGPVRYYLHAKVKDGRYGDPSNRYTLLSGRYGQREPDTVLVTTSIPRLSLYPQPPTFNCRASRRFAGWLYAAKHSSTVGWSSDFGSSWTWSSIPIDIATVTPWPSQVDPMRILVDARETDPLKFGYAGLYYTSNGGNSYHRYNDDEEVGTVLARYMFTTADDRYFLCDNDVLSTTDYGRSWAREDAGLEAGTIVTGKYQSHSDVVLTSNTGMYVYSKNGWQKLLDRSNRNIWPAEWQERAENKDVIVEYGKDKVYLLIPLDGLYRINIKDNTTEISEWERATAKAYGIDIYPNPVTTGTAFHVTLPGEASGRLQLFDALGRQVLSRQVSRETTLSTTGFTPGVYFLTGEVGGVYQSTRVVVY